MAETFRDHPTQPGVRLWKRSSWSAIGSAITLLLCVFLVAMVLAATGAAVLKPGPLTIDATFVGLAIGVVVMVVVMGAIAQLLWRDMRGKSGASIMLSDAGLTLRLPAGRSLIHAPPACRTIVPWSNIKCIETRREIYGAQGMAMMNRVYRLRLHTGNPIFLFEQRGLRSNVVTPSMQELAEEIAARAGGRVRDVGKYEGRGGLLGAWFAAPPDWTATQVSRTRWETMQRRVTMTAWVGAAALGVTWLATWLSSAF
jgi:hypothetical protein